MTPVPISIPITVKVSHHNVTTGKRWDENVVIVRCTKTQWVAEDGRKFSRVETWVKFRGEGVGETLGCHVDRREFSRLDYHFGAPEVKRK